MQRPERLHDSSDQLIDATVGMFAAVIPQPVVIFVTHDAILSEGKRRTLECRVRALACAGLASRSPTKGWTL
jgi:hypothetical protein